ncbi:MAG: hypothetical protein GF308_20450 [Candidatus Heimdallarchaeota archaeon]|nr:hypothetical protein [Candidatus Heimdallarchaeota archaeon]
MSKKLKKRLEKQLAQKWHEKADVNIGKKGISAGVVGEIDRRLEEQALIKIKFLQNFLTEDFSQAIQQLVKKTNSQLVEKRGKTVILYRAKQQQERAKSF